jgi:benzylsuccinate CoA-transferase BbsF subunit
MQLAHLGAEVIKIETASRPCGSRLVPPYADGKPGLNRAGGFNQSNQGKRSLALNLRRPEGLEIIHELVKHCDVVVENFAGGVSERLGIGYSKLSSIKPDIIMISMPGYGQTGPYRNYLSYGPLASALSGLFYSTGYGGGEPSECGPSFGDPSAGIFGAFAIVAALIHRDLTSEGQYIDQSQLEVAVNTMPEAMLQYEINRREPERMGNHDPLMSPHECYKARGDENKWISIAVGSEDEWRALCAEMGQPKLAEDPRFRTAELRKRNEAELDALITRWTRERDRWEAAQSLQRAGVAAFPSMSNKDIATDPHLDARGYLVALEHPEVGRRIHTGIPWKMSGTPCEVRSPAPTLGADTERVLTSVLGYTHDRVEQLRADGVLV